MLQESGEPLETNVANEFVFEIQFWLRFNCTKKRKLLFIPLNLS